jgi:hypothetical protein
VRSWNRTPVRTPIILTEISLSFQRSDNMGHDLEDLQMASFGQHSDFGVANSVQRLGGGGGGAKWSASRSGHFTSRYQLDRKPVWTMWTRKQHLVAIQIALSLSASKLVKPKCHCAICFLE